MTLAGGVKLGPYEILSPLGAGGMGEVWKAKDTRLDRFVAVKVLPEHLASHPEALARFEREAKAVAALSHPNILGIFDVGRVDDTAYAVMELLEGESLRARLGAGALPVKKAVELAVQMAHGLAAAHEKGIVHRDLKPENLWVTKDGRLKILDFGLAKQTTAPVASPDQSTGTFSPGHHTDQGTILGTVGYMSPEQVRGEAVDARSDVFSFGVVLYEMLGGARPFKGTSAVEVMHAILRDEPPELDAALKVPPLLERVLHRCLAKEPGSRLHSAHDLAFALGDASSGTVMAAPPTARAGWAWWALAALAVLSAALAGWFFRGGPTPPPTFTRLTFFRGTLDRAAFAHHGQTILYSAQVDGQPSSLYSLPRGAAEPTRLGPPGTHLLSVSSGNDVLVLRNPVIFAVGKERWNVGALARTTEAGTGMRELAGRVADADWAPDGERLAMVGVDDSQRATSRVEFPVGTIVYRSSGTFATNLRVSPDGTRLLFLEFAWVSGDSPIQLQVRGPNGQVATLARGLRIGSAIWDATGREIWLAEHDGNQTTVSTLSLRGVRRTLWRGAGRFELQGIDEHGALLVSLQRRESQVEMDGDAPDLPHNLSWLNSTFAFAFSGDGRDLLFTESETGSTSLDGIYVRRSGEPGPVRLGGGWGCDLSPDGRTVLAADADGQFRLIPTGAGAARDLDTGPGNGSAGWFFPDGRRILLDKTLPDGSLQMLIYDLDRGSARPAAPRGYSCYTGERPLSPDGTRMALYATDPETFEDSDWIVPVDGAKMTRLDGVRPREVLLGWGEDGRGIYVFERVVLPTQIVRVDVATGRREPWKTFVPADPAGIRGITNFEMSRDGRRVAFNYERVLTQLYLVEGLR